MTANDILKLKDAIYELEQTTATIGLIQTAFAEGVSRINMKEAGISLMMLYLKQGEVLDSIHDVLKEKNSTNVVKEVA